MPIEPIEIHLDNNSFVISNQIVRLLFMFTNSAYHTIEIWVIPALNHAIILGMPSLHQFNPIIDL